MEVKFIKYSKALSNISENILPPSSLTDSLSLSLLPPSLSERDKKYGRWKDAVERCLHWEGGDEDRKHREKKINGKSKSASL